MSSLSLANRWTRLAGLALAGLLILPACTDGGERSASAPTGQTQLAPIPAAPQQLLNMMVDAPQTVVYQGTRRYESYWDAEGTPEVLIYREDVLSNGRGGFSIDPIELIEPDISSAQADLFLLLQKTREGFFFEHRDFAIRDLQLFLQQWVVSDLGPVTYLGQSCTDLQIQRQVNPERVYQLTVDTQNGLVLQAKELSLSGTPLSLVKFESLTYMPSLTGAIFHQAFTTETVVTSTAQLRAALTYVPAQPKLLPPGYQLMEIATVTEATQGGAKRDWARFTYSDGVDEVFFLHEGKAAAGVVPGGGVGPTGGGGGSGGGAASSAKSGVGQPPGPQDTIQYLHVGPWTVVFGEFEGDSYLAMGKVSRDELQDLVESAFF